MTKTIIGTWVTFGKILISRRIKITKTKKLVHHNQTPNYLQQRLDNLLEAFQVFKFDLDTIFFQADVVTSTGHAVTSIR